MKHIFLAGLCLSVLSSCTIQSADSSSANPDASRVFAATKGAASTAVVTGIWESARPQTSGPLTSTSRFEFRDTFMVAAARCTRDGAEPVLVGGRSPATVTAELIEIRQSISDTKTIGADAACQVRASAGVLPVCLAGSAPADRTSPCFELTGTTLDIYQNGSPQSFVKISD